MKLRLLCDSVFDAREMQNSNFQDNVLEVLSKSNEDFIEIKSANDSFRLEKLCKKLRKMIVILHLFPIEFKIAMTERSYGSVVRDFLALYLNIKALLSISRSDSEAFINEAIREVFLVLGSDDEASIWMVLPKFVVFENHNFLQALVDVSIEKTRRTHYTYEQYISLVGFLYKYFSIDENAKRPFVLKAIANFKPPKGIAKYLSHHFSIRDWGDCEDMEIHKKLFIEPKPVSFVLELGKKISLEGVEDVRYNGCDNSIFDKNKFEDDDEQDTRTDDREQVNGDIDKYEKVPFNEFKVSHKSKKKKKKKRAGDELRESSAPKKSANSENDALEAFYAGVSLKNPIILIERIKVPGLSVAVR